jgi:hypothetical protein
LEKKSRKRKKRNEKFAPLIPVRSRAKQGTPARAGVLDKGEKKTQGGELLKANEMSVALVVIRSIG